MTRKDYVLIARALANAEPPVKEKDARRAWYGCCVQIAHVLDRDNHRFNRDMFMSACNVKEGV